MLWGGAIVAFCFLVGGLLLWRGLEHEVEFAQLFPLLAAAFFFAAGCLFLYWTWGCQSLRYVVDRNALSIRWGGVQQVIPLDGILRLVPAADYGYDDPDAEGAEPRPAEDEQGQISIDGVSWPGHHVGKAFVPLMGGEVLFYSTHRKIDEVLYIQTHYETYAVSVPDQIVFAQTIQAAQARGALFQQHQHVHRWGIAALSFWQDANARLLAAMLVASFVAVLAYVLQQYPGLPQSVALSFPSLGGIVRVADKSELLDIPRSGLGFLAVNLTFAVFLHAWERMVGYVLLLAGIAVQVMLLVAAILAVQ